MTFSNFCIRMRDTDLRLHCFTAAVHDSWEEKKMFTIKQACWMCKNRDPPSPDGMQYISEFQNKKPDPQ